MLPKYKRILLKLSGEALMGNKNFGLDSEVIVTENYGTYTDRKAHIQGKEYGWNHSISEILNSLINAGIEIQQFNDFNYSPYPNFAGSVEVEKGKWLIKGLEGKIPVVYSVKSIKKQETIPIAIGTK